MVESRLWTVEVNGGRKKKVTAMDAARPHWSPTGDRIAFQAGRDIWVVLAEGGAPFKLTKDPATDQHPVWSPKGDELFFCSDRGGSSNIWKVSVDEGTGKAEGEPVPVTFGPGGYRTDFALSRDVKGLAYTEHQFRRNLHLLELDSPRRRSLDHRSY